MKMHEKSSLKMGPSSTYVSDHAIFQLELLAGVRLPGDYVLFLKNINGMSPSIRGFQSRDGLMQVDKGALYVLKASGDDGNDVRWAFEVLKRFMPVGVVPIAYDHSGNQICLDMRAGAKEQVVLWHLERPGLVHPAARTFTEFIRGVLASGQSNRPSP